MQAKRPARRRLVWGIGLLLAAMALSAGLFLTRDRWRAFLFSVTGEENLFAQVRGGLEWLGNLTRPQPQTDDWVPIANAGLNPFGVNTFLEQEVDPAKRERAMQMISEAGFHWIRQEFPWEDIEISAKGDFEDRRNVPYRSAWDKYDAIVDLADKYGVEIIARLSNPPEWSRAKGSEAGSFAPPDNLKDYGDFVETVVRRYRGHINYYQVWNEPNIYPEWGEQPVSPEAYTELLKEGYTRIKAACPECVVISGALAQTIPLGPRDLNDFIFLQRMYDAGAADYFDVLAIQGYGLWSGPTDRRMRPRVLNFSRPLYVREIMVKNGDAQKPIWITEMNWNAPPIDLPQKPFGFVTPEQQARNAVLAYQRAQKEWPWVGVITTWFFKRATDQEKDQPMYYFALVEPDFTPRPIYNTLKEYMHQPPVVYPGVHQEDHWPLSYEGAWEQRRDLLAELGAYRYSTSSQARLDLTFEGTEVWIKPGPDGTAGTWVYALDGEAERSVSVEGPEPVRLVGGLAHGQHSLSLRPGSGPLSIDSLIVRQRSVLVPWLWAGAALAGVAAAAIAGVAGRRWYHRCQIADGG